MYIICKICNPTLQGNGYCAEHSTGGSSYFDNYGKHNIKSREKVLERNMKVINKIYIVEINGSEVISPIKQPILEISNHCNRRKRMYNT